MMQDISHPIRLSGTVSGKGFCRGSYRLKSDIIYPFSTHRLKNLFCNMPMQPSTELLPFPATGAVRVNVGGERFLTTAQTLASQCAYFNSLCSENAMPTLFLPDEQGGAFFIDRDAAPFRFLLTFLRSGIAPTDLSTTDRALLHAEAQFYGCEALTAALDAQQQPETVPEPMRKIQYMMSHKTVSLLDASSENLNDATFLAGEASLGWKVQQLFCETTLLICSTGHQWSGFYGDSAEVTSGNCPICGQCIFRRRKRFSALLYREVA